MDKYLFEYLFLILFGLYWEMGLLAHIVIFVEHVEEHLNFFTVTEPFTFSTTIYEGSSFLTSSLKLVISLYFYNLLESFSCPRNHICWREYSFLHWIFWTCFWKSVEHRYMVLWVLNSKFHFIGVYVYLMSVTHYFDCSVSKSESVSHLTLFLFLLFFWKCFSYSGSPMIPHEL